MLQRRPASALAPVLVPALVLVLVLVVSGCSTGDDDAGGAATTTRPLSQPTQVTETSATTETTGETTGPAEATGTTETTGETTGTTVTGGPASTTDLDGPVTYRVEVVATHPHDPTAYTQGLEVVGDLLLESTGLRGQSSIRLVEPSTGRVVRSRALDDDLFGEGATVVGDEVWQLTWTSERLLIHDLDDLDQRRQLSYRGQGWGLCATPRHLVMSDGSSQLTIRDRTTFEIIDEVEVNDTDGPVAKINELECVDGVVWANVFQTTRLLAIDPGDGRVVGSADLSPLVPPGFEGDGGNVANGVAHDPATGRFWLTGKRWPVLYEVELIPES